MQPYFDQTGKTTSKKLIEDNQKKMENDLKKNGKCPKKMEDELTKNEKNRKKITKKTGRWPKTKMEEDIKKNGRQP